MRKVRINVLMPDELVEEISQSVGSRKRSSFLVEAAQEKLERMKQAEALREAFGSWSEELHPELKTQEDIDRWVRSLRQSDADRMKGLDGEDISIR
jgi:Arc/MetJ-type ribon-helix-helix transcriptional regulator